MKTSSKLKFLVFLALMALIAKDVGASGIQVLNTSVTTNEDRRSAQVAFTLAWDHSWRLADGPANWDAAWVIIKYRTLPGDNWFHAYLSATTAHHRMPSNAAMSLGPSRAVVGGANTTVQVGAFIHRNAAGSGTIVFENCELRWDFTQNGLTGGEQVEVCVIAIEMVHIPERRFFIGDHTSVGHFMRNRTNPTTTQNSIRAEDKVVEITAQNAGIGVYFSNYHATLWNSGGNFTNNNNALYNGAIASTNVTPPGGPTPDDANPGGRNNGTRVDLNLNNGHASVVNANFPKGFSAFYCMKYEITQGEYLQFLNKNLVAVKNSGTNGVYFSGATAGRQAIRIKSGTGTANIPREYELTTPSAAFLPASHLNTRDILAWLVWAGLRPMTELEFEKVCRGADAVPATASLKPQYAWGSVQIANAAGFSNKGQANEAPSNQDGNVAVSPIATASAIGGAANANLDGPMRSGGFATPVSSREKAGATYYGVMEMSGNLWERAISIGVQLMANNYAGMSISGHGNGDTGPLADPDLPIGGGWPAVASTAGLGFRGGSYLDPADRARISDRMFINANGTTRHVSFGGRGVRTTSPTAVVTGF